MTVLPGRRVVITRPGREAQALARALSDRGAVPIVFPTITREPTSGMEQVLPALAALRPGDWIVVTSPYAGQLLGPLLGDGPARADTLGLRVAAVGVETALTLGTHGIRVAAIPPEERGDRIADVLGDLRGRRVLVPGSSIGRPETVTALEQRGAEVRRLAIYHTAAATPAPPDLDELRRGFDAILFASPSAVDGFFTAVGRAAADLLAAATVVCIGPTTGAAVTARGIVRPVIASHPSASGLLEALEEQFSPTGRTFA